MGKRKRKQRFFYLIKKFSLAEGEEIEQELINKTKQETVPNIFIKQQHIGLFNQFISILKYFLLNIQVDVIKLSKQ